MNESLQAGDTATGQSHDLPLAEYDRAVAEAVGHCSGRKRHCARNAFENLRRAYALLGVDNEMAAFRAITAEEEAATSVYLALKDRDYPDADKLKIREHLHKAALYPMVQAVARLMKDVGIPEPNITLDKEAPKISIMFPARWFLDGFRDDQYFCPEHPLDFLVAKEGKLHGFESHLMNIASENGFDRILDYLRSSANLRNRVLYASDQGIPKITVGREFIISQKDRVVTLLSLMIAIQQTPDIQLFAKQVLGALLKVLTKLEDMPDFNGDDCSTGGPCINIDLREPENKFVSYFLKPSEKLPYTSLSPWYVTPSMRRD